MILGYQDFYYNVQDLNRAVRFYESAFGLKTYYANEHWVSLGIGDLKLGLHWTEGSPVPKNPRDSHGSHCGGTLTFRSTDVNGDRLKIEAAGGKILSASVQPWGEMLVFEDLDGNVLKLMNPK